MENSTTLLTKVEKGRLKKLVKRAKSVQANAESGICQAMDWEELMELRRKQSSASLIPENAFVLGPSVLWRSGKARERVEGTDVRAVLRRLIEQQPHKRGGDISSSENRTDSATDTLPNDTAETSRKRKHVSECRITQANVQDQNRFKLPQWVTLHNAAAARHVAVLEIHCHDVSRFLACQQAIRQCLRENESCLATESPTRWFTNNFPKSITDVLMYAPDPKPTCLPPNKVTSLQHLYNLLNDLVVKDDDWQREDYPALAVVNESTHTTVVLPSQDSSACEPASPSTSMERSPGTYNPNGLSCTSATKKSDGLPPYVGTTIVKAAIPVVEAPSPFSSHRRGIFAMDCEMVVTSKNASELARITIVKVESVTEEGHVQTKVVWDQLVKPKHTITNYLTQFSGMTPALLKDVTFTLEDVQDYLLRNIQDGDIVIGHSLENDLRATRWVHRRIVDTALLFQPTHGRFKYSLRHLTAQLLQRQIQQADQSHCSEEDAIAALELAVRRAVQGSTFGVPDKTHRNQLSSMAKNETTVCIGPSSWLQTHVTSQPNAIHALACESIEDWNHKAVAAWLTGPKRRARMVWANWSVENDSATSIFISTLSGLLTKRSLTNTVIMVALQPSYGVAAQLHQQRKVKSNPKATMGWSDMQEAGWIKASEDCQTGSVFWVGTKIG
jgi:DNA polymerase III epsilon subunit-like protein